MKVPSATSSTPASSTRPAPMRSATAPANGCVRPQNSWPKAKARLMLPRPSPVEVLIGERNRPMVWRVPIVSAKVPAAASSTSQSAGWLLLCEVIVFSRKSIRGVLAGIGTALMRRGLHLASVRHF